VLECIKQEFYRRKLAPYEEAKIKENGDLWENVWPILLRKFPVGILQVEF
jgi:hypothetical protein